MNKTMMEINKNSELYENYTGTILLTEKAILTVFSKVRGDIFLSPDCQLIVKGDINESVIYADQASVVDVQISKCHVKVYLNEALLRIENGCELIGDIISDGGHIIGGGKHTGSLKEWGL